MATELRQAGLIQKEVIALSDDVGRLDGRVGNLLRHFGQAEADLRQIRISTEKVHKRTVRIREVDLSNDEDDTVTELPTSRAALEGD